MSNSHEGILLSVRVRLGDPNESFGGTNNNFVRLSPQTAQRLFDTGVSELLYMQDSGKINAESRRSGWWIDHEKQSSRCTSGVEFLPLAVTFDSSGETIFASYNGGDLSEENHPVCTLDEVNPNCFIDLPSSLLTSTASLDLTGENSRCTVHVKALPYVAYASELEVEPVTCDDWDLVQLDAVSLEGGSFLQQISVVFMDQTFDLWLNSGRKVSVSVLPRSFELLRSTAWPNDCTGLSWCQSFPCLRIIADTKILIVPKPRTVELRECPLRMVPTCQDFSMTDPSVLQFADCLNVRLVSVTEKAMFVHPNTLHRIRGYDENADLDPQEFIAFVQAFETGSSNKQNVAISEPTAVLVVLSADVPEDCVAIHPFLRLGMKAPFPSKKSIVVVKRLLSSLEAAKYSRKIPDLLRSGHAKLRLIPIAFKTSQDSSPWRSPYSERTDQGVAAMFGCLYTEVTRDYPVNIGEILVLPGEETLYRICLQWNVIPLPAPTGAFVYYQRLLELFRHSLESDEHCCTRELDQTEFVKDLAFRGALSRLLPKESYFCRKLLCRMQSVESYANGLIYGDRGIGKTHTALTKAAAARIALGYNVAYLNCRKLRDSYSIRMKTVLTELAKAFEEAMDAAPCMLILDDLDALIPSFDSYGPQSGSAQVKEVNSTEIEQAKLISDLLRRRINLTKGRVFVTVTSQIRESLPRQLLLEGNFSHQIGVPSLDDSGREDMYRLFLRQVHRFKEGNSLEGLDIARRTRGFRPRDLEQLAFHVYKLCLSKSERFSWKQATSQVLESFTPLSHSWSKFDSDAIVQSMEWSDLGGIHRAKAELVSRIVTPSLYRRIYDRSCLRLPRGLLLFGYPGTGKSLCVPALAKECGYPLIVCRGPEVLDKYIGASEAKVRALFTQAAACAPSILFFDELDALAPRRGSDSSGVTDRVVNQLLTFLDGVELSAAAVNCPVYVIGATSRPDKVDPALLRPGRLERHVFFGLTDDLDDLSDLLEKISDQFLLDSMTKSAIVCGDFARLVSASNPDKVRLFSAADFTAVFRSAQLMAAHKALALGRTNDAVCITHDNLVEAMMSARPSLSISDNQFLSDIYDEFRLDAVSSSNMNRSVKSLITALK